MARKKQNVKQPSLPNITGVVNVSMTRSEKNTWHCWINFQLNVKITSFKVEYDWKANLAHNLARDIKNHLSITMGDFALLVKEPKVSVYLINVDNKGYFTESMLVHTQHSLWSLKNL